MQLFYEFVILFFIFAVLGWMMEVTLKYIQYHRFINRGFLIGPYCPIYGAGVVGVTVLVGGLIGREGTYGETFLAGFVICGFLEYMTSLYMEKMFHARWWDYSDKPMNLHGRIWIGNLILFGLASLVIVKFIDPHYFDFIEGMNVKLLAVLSWSIIILMAFDYGLSHFLMNIVKKEIDLTYRSNYDGTMQYYRMSATLWRNPDSDTPRIFGTIQNVTAIAEKELRACLLYDYITVNRDGMAKKCAADILSIVRADALRASKQFSVAAEFI